MLNSSHSVEVFPADTNEYLSSNFRAKEFDCPNSFYTLISSQLVAALQVIRTQIQMPMKIESGYRTPEYNSSIGGHIYSYHQLGMAADFSFERPGTPFWGVQGMLEEWLTEKDYKYRLYNVGGIGFYPNRHFIHIDVQPRINNKVKVWYE